MQHVKVLIFKSCTVSQVPRAINNLWTIQAVFCQGLASRMLGPSNVHKMSVAEMAWQIFEHLLLRARVITNPRHKSAGAAVAAHICDDRDGSFRTCSCNALISEKQVQPLRLQLV